MRFLLKISFCNRRDRIVPVAGADREGEPDTEAEREEGERGQEEAVGGGNRTKQVVAPRR